MLDIKFKSNLESLEIGEAVINLQRNSSLFSAKINNQTISYSFTVVATPNNVRNLKIPHIIESPDNFEDFEILISINNSIELEGILSIEDANDKYLKLSFVSQDIDISFLQEELSEFDYGTDIDVGPDTSDVIAHVLSVNDNFYPDTTHVFPMVHNTEFYGDENTEFLGVVNNYDIVGETMVANTNTPVKNKNALVPYFFLVFFLKKIFESNNIVLKGSFIEHAEVQKLLVHNNLALDEFDIERSFVRASLTSDFNLPNATAAHTIIFDDDSTFPNEDTSSIYNTTLGEFTIPHEGILNVRLYNLTVTNYTSATPVNIPVTFEFSTYIDSIQVSSNNVNLILNETKTVNQLNISGNWFLDAQLNPYYQEGILVDSTMIGKKVRVKCNIIYESTNPNPSAKIHAGVIAEYNLDKWTEFNVYAKTISPQNHVPKMTAESFVNAMISGFKLIPFYDKIKRELYLYFFDEIFDSLNYDDITNNVTAYNIKKLNNTGFNVNYNFQNDTLLTQSPDVSKFAYVGVYNSVDDLPSPPTVSLMAYVKSVNAFYVSLVTTGINWVRYKENFDNFIINDGAEQFVIDFAPFIMDQLSIDNDGAATMREFLLPKIEEQGSSFFYKTGINEPAFKLLIWHGMVDGPTAAKPYPFASSYNFDQAGNRIGDLSFNLATDDDSFYVQFLANYFQFLLNTKKVEHVYTSEIKGLFNYNLLEKKLILNQRFLTGLLKFKITKRGFENIVAENYKV